MTDRRSLDELKAAAIQLATDLLKTPSRKELSKVVKESEYSFYGMTLRAFQEYCGMVANSSGLAKKVSDEQMLCDLAKVCLLKKEIPQQVKLRKWIRDGEYSYHTLQTRFGGLINTQKALCRFAKRAGYDDNFFCLPGWKIDCSDEFDEDTDADASSRGFVYMQRHGNRSEYKIGKTNDLARREGELKTQLPEQLEPIHYIETDDSSGVENYWHRRFADKRKNGEWFDLSREDVSAFKRWRKIF
jgi:hypothetical protein